MDKDAVLNASTSVDEIFNEVAKDRIEDIQDNLCSEFDYVLAFNFPTAFEKIVCKYKYTVTLIDNHDTSWIFISFNINNPTIKWINSIKTLFKRITTDLSISYDISGLNVSDSYLEKNEYYKFGFFDWKHIAKQEERQLRNQIEYSHATERVADTIAQEMVLYEPNGFLIALKSEAKELMKCRRFEISWQPEVFHYPITHYTCDFYKEALLQKSYTPSITQHNEITKNTSIKIEFARIYESLKRYIFVALYKPDKPRDFGGDYNYKYTYYTFYIEKGNYLTDALKLRRTLVNTFGEGTGLNIESEIIKQKK